MMNNTTPTLEEKKADDLATSITNLSFEKGARLRNQDYLNVWQQCLEAITTAKREALREVIETVKGMLHREFMKGSPAKHQNDAFLKVITHLESELSV